MRVRTALLLLLTLGLGLGLGVHPCDAAEGQEHPSAKAHAAPAAPSSCHAQRAPSAATQEHASHTGEGHHDGRGSAPCSSDQPCPHLCHATALAAVVPPVLTVHAVVAALATVPVESVPTAPAQSIDHVPLP